MFIYSNISGSYSFVFVSFCNHDKWGGVVGAKPDPETRHSMLIGFCPIQGLPAFHQLPTIRSVIGMLRYHLERQDKGMHSDQCHGCQGSCKASV